MDRETKNYLAKKMKELRRKALKANRFVKEVTKDLSEEDKAKYINWKKGA